MQAVRHPLLRVAIRLNHRLAEFHPQKLAQTSGHRFRLVNECFKADLMLARGWDLTQKCLDVLMADRPDQLRQFA